MSDLSVTERRIRPIYDAAATKNWKQALQLCDKWYKKGEKSDRFLALKASVLVNQPDRALIEKGKQETLQLCQRKDAVTDIEALHQLQGSLKLLSLENTEGPKLWEKAALALPNDKGLMTSWLNDALADSNWLMAQKAAMTLRKSFPKERHYDFWNILLCYLAHGDLSLAEKDRTLYGMLAFRLMSKAAEAVPSDPSQVLASGKAIATTEELSLLLQIYLSTSHVSEAVDLLQSDNLGLRSRIAEQDVQMVFSLLLQALEALLPSVAVVEICQRLILEENSPIKDLIDDDRIWRIVVQAGNSENYSLWDKCLALTESILARHSSCRAAHLARLGLLQYAMVASPDRRKELIDACQSYFELFKLKPFCFEDLGTSLKSLKSEEVQNLIPQASAGVSSTEQLFSLKAKYTMCGDTEPEESELLNLAAEAVCVSNGLPEMDNGRPEAILLAGLALLRVAAKTSDYGLVLQVCFMYEASYTKFGEYYPLAVRLVQIYRSVGLASPAAERFTSLSIKNMQWETVGHLLLTRISTFHPLTAGQDESSLNPLYVLDAGLEMLDAMEASLSKAIQKGIGFGSYANVLDTVRLKNDVRQSLNRQIYLLEERKIQNLVNIPVATLFESQPGPLVDNRDFTFLNRYGVDDRVLDDFLSCGFLPGRKWLHAMIFVDHIHQYLRFELLAQTRLASDALEASSISFEQLQDQQDDLPAELTPAERRTIACHRQIYETVMAMRSPTSTHTDLDTAVDNLIMYLAGIEPSDTNLINEVRVPGWHYLHASLCELEALQTVYLLMEVLTRKPKTSKTKAITPSKEQTAALQTAIERAEDIIRSDAKSLKNSINSPGVLGALIDAATGRLETGPLSELSSYRALSEQSATLYDEVFVEEYCGKMRDSWSSALDCILAIKVSGSR